VKLNKTLICRREQHIYVCRWRGGGLSCHVHMGASCSWKEHFDQIVTSCIRSSVAIYWSPQRLKVVSEYRECVEKLKEVVVTQLRAYLCSNWQCSFYFDCIMNIQDNFSSENSDLFLNHPSYFYTFFLFSCIFTSGSYFIPYSFHILESIFS